jgi:hypothetical protein
MHIIITACRRLHYVYHAMMRQICLITGGAAAMRKKAKKQRAQETRQIRKLKQEKKKLLLEEVPGFKPEYCTMLVEHCSLGYSFRSFAAGINVLPELLEEWTEKCPEFKKARTLAAFNQKVFWEKKAVEACSEKFSIGLFRYITGSIDENPEVPGFIVILPEEEEDSEDKGVPQ